jgi:hypothetical protein
MLTIRISRGLMLFGNSTAVDTKQCRSKPKLQSFHVSWKISIEVQSEQAARLPRGYRAASLRMLGTMTSGQASASLFDPEFAPALRADIAVDQRASIRLLE